MLVVRYTKIFLIITAVIFAVSAACLGVFGLQFGIDFTGGALTEVSYEERPEKETLEAGLNTLQLGGYSLRGSVDETGRSGYILRTRSLAEEERQAVNAVLTFDDTRGDIGRFTSIGPTIGEELRGKAIVAMGLVVLIIVLYVAFAFRGISKPVRSWVYGGIVILALVHDVLIPAALFAVLGQFVIAEVDVLFVMAILAVLGYSVNDTIVVFDRVRENILKDQEANKHEPFKDIVGRSLSQTYARSINTSLTTLLALLALYVFGADVTRPFALVLIAGVIAGTYSSIFIASPLLVAIEEWQRKRRKGI